MLTDRLKGRSHETLDDLLNPIDKILSEILKETWEVVYDERISRLDQVTKSESEYL